MSEKQKILIADDSEMNRAMLKEILGSGYDYLEAGNGAEAVELMRSYTDIALLLLDIVMPVMDGFDVLRVMNCYSWQEEIPVIMISAEENSAVIERAYDMGVTDYIRRPFERFMVLRRVQNVLMLYTKQKRLTRLVSDQVYEKEHNSVLMIAILSHVVEFRNSESGQHVLHIRTLTDLLLRQLVRRTDRYQLGEREISLISIASALHDIGKITIPEEILNKPGRLTAEEFAIVKTHTTAGAELLKDMGIGQDEPLIRVAYAICRWHHERWDGSGYPDRLKGDEIPIAAQVVALADVYDALTSERCYKPPYDHETALRMILNGECGVFNPLLMECLRESSGLLKEELHRSEWDRGFRQETHRLSEEILHREALPQEDRSQRLLDMARRRADFYAGQCGGIQFEYNLLNGMVRVTDPSAEVFGQAQMREFDNGQGLTFLCLKDRQKLLAALQAATPEKPEAEFRVQVQVGAVQRWHRLVLHTLWSNHSTTHCVTALGQLTDIHEQCEQENEAAVQAAQPSRVPVMTLMQQMKDIFDVVRLVDPEHTRELELKQDGTLVEQENHCYAVWKKDGRCENCISAKVYARKTALNKIEFREDAAYFVLARYVEVNGRPCVLELVSKLAEGRWVDVGGRRLMLDNGEALDRGVCVDPLTGTYSRWYFEKFLAQGEQVDGVIVIDLDHFKSVNDTFGHLVGDKALQATAAAVQSCLKDTSVLVRYGGDEFVLLLPHTTQQEVDAAVQEIRQAISGAQVPSHPEIKFSASVGGVYGVHPLTDAIRAADKAMYQEKTAKRS